MNIYLDSGDITVMREMIGQVAGVTTNPSLLKANGVANYREFAGMSLLIANGKPISFETFADEMNEMESQARQISSWGENVYVKIPITNTKGEPTYPLVKKLTLDGIKVNLTAVTTLEQIRGASFSLHPSTPCILSIFCGRIADTGRDPLPFITESIRVRPGETKILWASTREVLNVKQAQAAGADIITMTPGLIMKMGLFGKDLAQYSLETVQQFYKDAQGITL